MVPGLKSETRHRVINPTQSQRDDQLHEGEAEHTIRAEGAGWGEKETPGLARFAQKKPGSG